MPEAVAGILRAELAAAGLMPHPLRIKLVGARMGDRGQTEFNRFCPAVPSIALLSSVCAHHMGVGASFTEFLISGIPLTPQTASGVASLGGIAHTIYALFDSLLDTCGSVPMLFSDEPVLADDPQTQARQRIVLDLVDLYFREIQSLSLDGSPRYTLLRRTIQKLYEAELCSAVPGEVRSNTWWRKNVLPIVVMALPAWLLMPDESTITFAGHLRWISRVGEFLGWLDDFSDYEYDSSSGQLNRLQSAGPPGEFASKVGAKGRRVLEWWDSINNDSPSRDTFTVIAWMWLAPRQSELPPDPPRAGPRLASPSL